TDMVLGALDLDVATHGCRAHLDERPLALGGRVSKLELRARLAAHRLGVDPELRALLDSDLDVAGGGLQRHLPFAHAVDPDVAGSRLHLQRGGGLVDGDVSRGGADLALALEPADLDVAGGGVLLQGSVVLDVLQIVAGVYTLQ